MLLGHFDTVWDVGQLDRMPLREEGGRLYGPGVYDMKAAIAVALQAVRVRRERAASTSPRVVMLWTTDEEIGSETSRALSKRRRATVDAVLVLEPSLPGGAAKTRAQRLRRVRADVPRRVGARRHRSAARERARFTRWPTRSSRSEQLRDAGSRHQRQRRTGRRAALAATSSPRKRARPSTFACRRWRMRHRGRGEDARAPRPGNPGVRIEVDGGIGRPPLERTEGVARLYQAGDGRWRPSWVSSLAEGGTGGGSDGNFTAALGVPTLDGLGPRGDGAHALHEHVVIADLPWRAAFLAALMHRINASKI